MENSMKDGGIFSIGHSTHSIDRFIDLLKKHHIDVVADVRSSPFSRFNPQFNKGNLVGALQDADIKYVFFGNELGARVDDPSCYAEGQVQYDRLAAREEFKQAISRLIEDSTDHRIALMCAEKEPLDCHRTILVSQAMFEGERKIEVSHIHANGTLECHSAALDRLMDMTGLSGQDFFTDDSEQLQEALAKQESKIAYKKKD